MSEKIRLQRTRIRRNSSLHTVSAQMTTNGHVDRVGYSDSDSDEGLLMVRKDSHFTYDRSARVLTELRRPVADGVTSQEGDISSDEDSSIHGISKFSEKEKENMKDISSKEAGLDSSSKKAFEVSEKHEEDKTKELSNKEASVEYSKNIASDSKIPEQKSLIKKSSEELNGVGSSKSESSRTRKGSGTCNSKSQSQKMSNDVDHDEIDGVSFQTSSAKGENTSSKRTNNTSTSQRSPNKRPTRRRRRTSPAKYGDLYYGADYVLDSEDELEVERESKRCRKSKLVAREDRTEGEAIVIDDSESEDEDYVPNQKEIDEFNSVHEKNVEDEKDVVHIEDDAKTDVKPSSSKCESDIKKPVKVLRGPRGKYKKRSKDASLNLPKRTKGKRSIKGRMRKFDPSPEKFKYDHDSIQNMRLKKTLDLIKQKDKKPKDVSSEAKSVGPFIRLAESKERPTSCQVINVIESDQPTDTKKMTKKTTSVSVSTVHMSKVPSEKSVIVPNSVVLDETNWVCALCRKHSSYKFLGDLFGPYYVEGNVPNATSLENVNSATSDKIKKRKSLDQTSGAGDNGQKVRGRRKSATVVRPPMEVWVHEDCVAWADGVLLIGPKIYGLEEAADIASATVSNACKKIQCRIKRLVFLPVLFLWCKHFSYFIFGICTPAKCLTVI